MPEGRIALHIADAEESWFRLAVTKERRDWPSDYTLENYPTKEAIKTCMQALSIGGVQQDRALELRYLLGVSLEADGQQDQALAVYKKVLQVDPNYADVKSRMAWTRMSSKANTAE